MAGLLASGIALPQGERTPDQVMADPYMARSNPLMDMLVALFQQTEGVAKHKSRTSEARRQGTITPVSRPRRQGTITPVSRPKSNKMRETKGPVKARTAHRIADRRDELLRKLDE